MKLAEAVISELLSLLITVCVLLFVAGLSDVLFGSVWYGIGAAALVSIAVSIRYKMRGEAHGAQEEQPGRTS